MIVSIDKSGGNVAWGIKPEWVGVPIRGLEAGAKVVRRRFRARDAGVAFVKHVDGALSKHYLEICADGALQLGWEVGVNKRETA